ncbi:MAG TPA: GNAT family protein [Cellulomonas sp.]
MPYSALPTRWETDRLVLTPEVPDDARWLAELFTARGAGTVSPADAAVRIAAMQAVVAEHGIGARVLRTRPGAGPEIGTAPEAQPGARPLGYCAIVVGRGTLDEPELAYELLPAAQGHGYATEAARSLLTATFDTGRTRVWSTVRAWNAPSLRVLGRLGFRRVRSTVDDRGELVWHVAEAG